jgi:hypothetical protein
MKPLTKPHSGKDWPATIGLVTLIILALAFAMLDPSCQYRYSPDHVVPTR